jgi:hypothetical protein
MFLPIGAGEGGGKLWGEDQAGLGGGCHGERGHRIEGFGEDKMEEERAYGFLIVVHQKAVSNPFINREWLIWISQWVQDATALNLDQQY